MFYLSTLLFLEAWDTCCLPLEEGGLGLRKLADISTVAASKQVWRIISGEETAWTNWITKVLIKGENIWAFEMPSNPS